MGNFDDIYNKVPDSISMTMKNLYDSIHALSTEQLFLLLEDRHSYTHYNHSYGFIDNDLWRAEICHFVRWELLSRFALSYPQKRNDILRKDISMSDYVYRNTLRSEDIAKDKLVQMVSNKFLVDLNTITDLYQNYKVIYSIYQTYENETVSHSITAPSKYALEMIRIFPSLSEHVRSVYSSIGKYIDKHTEFCDSLDERNEKWFDSVIIPKIRKELERIYNECYNDDYYYRTEAKKHVEEMSNDDLFDYIFIQGKCNKLIAERERYANSTIRHDIPYEYSHFYNGFYPDIDKLLCSESEWFNNRISKRYQGEIERITETTYFLLDEILDLLQRTGVDTDEVKEKLHGESNWKDISRFMYAEKFIKYHKWELTLLEYRYRSYRDKDDSRNEVSNEVSYSDIADREIDREAVATIDAHEAESDDDKLLEYCSEHKEEIEHLEQQEKERRKYQRKRVEKLLAREAEQANLLAKIFKK